MIFRARVDFPPPGSPSTDSTVYRLFKRLKRFALLGISQHPVLVLVHLPVFVPNGQSPLSEKGLHEEF